VSSIASATEEAEGEAGSRLGDFSLAPRASQPLYFPQTRQPGQAIVKSRRLEKQFLPQLPLLDAPEYAVIRWNTRLDRTTAVVTKGAVLLCRLVAIACPLMFITGYHYFYEYAAAYIPLWFRMTFDFQASLTGATLAIALSARRRFNVGTVLQIAVVALVMGLPSSLSLTRLANRRYARIAVRAGYRIARALVAGASCVFALSRPWAAAGGGEQHITTDFTAFAGVTYSVVFGVLAFDLIVELCARIRGRGKCRSAK
jgi:hypothetical protein